VPPAPRVVPTFLLRWFWDELEKRGVSRRELEGLSGMTRPRRGDFLSTVAEPDLHGLYEAALVLTGDEALGISVASAVSAASLHLLGHLMLASVTLRQAMELTICAVPHLRERMQRLEELPDGRLRMGYLYEQRLSPGARVDAEMSVVFAYNIVKQFLEGSRELLTVQLGFPAPQDASAYLRAFPGGVEFDADGTFVVIPRAALDRRRTCVDPALPQQLYQLAQEQYGTVHGGADADWTFRVRRALRTQTAPRLVEPEFLARQLGVSSRGLARRLAREGVSLSALIDEALYEHARALLRRPAATSKEVAAALGYAELSSFFRAFRRWSGGLTPTEYRRHAARADIRS
jgi:AraC-like DNA-binding protein/transcriptional regulator with XRE-family HTH domain